MPGEIEVFVRGWLTTNMSNLPTGNLPLEVDRLAAKLTGDARAMGISGRDLNRALGDIDDYLTGQVQLAQAG